MQAIITKYHGATNTRGARFSARSASGIRVSVPVLSVRTPQENSRAAVATLCRRLGWRGNYAEGATIDGFVYVSVDGPVVKMD